jgi:hypothetical protein
VEQDQGGNGVDVVFDAMWWSSVLTGDGPAGMVARSSTIGAIMRQGRTTGPEIHQTGWSP